MASQRSYRITAVALALLMMISSTGFSLDLHYCQGKLKSFSVFGTAKNCHELNQKPSCHKSKKTCAHKNPQLQQSDSNDCCHNEMVVLEKSDLDATSPQSVLLQDIQLDFVFAYTIAFVLSGDLDIPPLPFITHKPPLPDRNLQILYQSFLI